MSLLSLALFLFSYAAFASPVVVTSVSPDLRVSEAIQWSSKRRMLESSTCRTGNPIDDCWRCDDKWETNRKKLADCAVGFGRNAVGGRDGDIYVVDNSSDDPFDPVPGTLRYGVIQERPLWIIFDGDMVIRLKEDLQLTSYKSIDGRGHNVQIAYGPCIMMYKVSNIIISNIYIHDCLPARRYTFGGYSDGDGISIFQSRDIWIDHCTLERCYDGLIDAVNGSTAITISNNYMLHHNEVMLLGHSDKFLADRNMRVTIAFNYFGEGLIQRMPRCRHGYFHIVNNIYKGWEMYAIGGSANPTIYSQGNVFMASDDKFLKEVTKRESTDGYEDWKNWNWKSDGDLMLNGAFFTSSGEEDSSSYLRVSSMVARPVSLLSTIHPSIGALSCHIGQSC